MLNTTPLLRDLINPEGQLPETGLHWLDNLRKEAALDFSVLGLPDRKQEAWHFTNLKALEQKDFRPAAKSADGPEIAGLSPSPFARLVIRNGRYDASASTLPETLPEGVMIGGLPEMLRTQPAELAPHLGQIGERAGRPLLSLNAAHLEDGVFISLAEGVELEAPIEILYEAEAESPQICHPRNLILLAAHARATLLERHSACGEVWSNGATEIRLGDSAHLGHYRLMQEETMAVNVHHTAADIATGANYDNFTLTLSCGLARNEMQARLTGAHAVTHLNGVYLIRDKMLCDTTSCIDHIAPDCQSNQTYKGVIDERARGVFQGRINVHRGAQRTDGYQLNRALLLSPKAEINAKPELEIFADDVKCSHGCTAGELDVEALFYLRSRGVPEAQAKKLLIGAYLSEALETLEDVATRRLFADLIHQASGYEIEVAE